MYPDWLTATPATDPNCPSPVPGFPSSPRKVPWESNTRTAARYESLTYTLPVTLSTATFHGPAVSDKFPAISTESYNAPGLGCRAPVRYGGTVAVLPAKITPNTKGITTSRHAACPHDRFALIQSSPFCSILVNFFFLTPIL